MKFKRKKVNFIILVSIILVSVNLINFNTSFDTAKSNIKKKINTSQNWTFKSILIDANDETIGNGTWANATEGGWASGEGTWENPYILENITIEGDFTTNGIEIRNSNVPFIIKNCNISHTGTGDINDGGIKLKDVYNGTIYKNNCSYNDGSGIFLDSCDNNTIINNTANNNNAYTTRHGIYLIWSDNNTIRNNDISDNYYGIYIRISKNNTIYGNELHANQIGIRLFNKSNRNLIEENTIEEGNYGIYLTIDCLNNTIDHNEIKNKFDGITIHRSSNNSLIINNLIKDCRNYGIYIKNETQICNNTKCYQNTFSNPSATKNAQDNGTNTKWDDGTIGNYWHDYSGIDLNDNGIGDTPYIVDLFKGIVDNYPIWTDSDDIAPKITILTPSESTLFTKDDEPPNFNVQVVDQSLDTKWYTIDSGKTNFTFINDQGTINNTAWQNMPDGNITITFHANDSLSRISTKSVKILKDTKAPSITIKSPSENATINGTSPEFSLKIFDPLLDWSWYTINDGTKIFNFSGSTIQIDQEEWDNLPDGIVNITFHANDTLARASELTIRIIKDTLLPALNFKGANINGTNTQNSPNFTITITEKYLDSVWVKICEKGTNQTFIQKINISDMITVAANSDSYDIPIQIDEKTWNSFQDGEIELIVYANDTAGNIGSMNVLITKESSTSIGDSIPFGSVYTIITIIALVSIILSYKTKRKKSIL